MSRYYFWVAGSDPAGAALNACTGINAFFAAMGFTDPADRTQPLALTPALLGQGLEIADKVRMDFMPSHCPAPIIVPAVYPPGTNFNADGNPSASPTVAAEARGFYLNAMTAAIGNDPAALQLVAMFDLAIPAFFGAAQDPVSFPVYPALATWHQDAPHAAPDLPAHDYRALADDHGNPFIALIDPPPADAKFR